MPAEYHILNNIPRTNGRYTLIRVGFNRLTGTDALADVLLFKKITYLLPEA